MDYFPQYFHEAVRILGLLDQSAIERTADLFLELRVAVVIVFGSTNASLEVQGEALCI